MSVKKIVTDNILDQEIARHRKIYDDLVRTSRGYMGTFQDLSPRERALHLQQFQKTIKNLQQFLASPKQIDLTNAGTRFALDTLKSNFNSFLGRWNKFEKSLG